MKSRRSCLSTRTARQPGAARQHSLRPAQPKAAAGQRCLRVPHAPRSASKPAPSAGFRTSASPLPVDVVVEERFVRVVLFFPRGACNGPYRSRSFAGPPSSPRSALKSLQRSSHVSSNGLSPSALWSRLSTPG